MCERTVFCGAAACVRGAPSVMDDRPDGARGLHAESCAGRLDRWRNWRANPRSGGRSLRQISEMRTAGRTQAVRQRLVNRDRRLPHPARHFSWRPITHILNLLLVMPAETNSHVLANFLDYLRIEKGLAPLSVSAYTTDVSQFAEFLGKHKRTLLTARRNEVREFLQQLFANQVEGRSVGRKLSALRHLYRYLLLDKKIDHDPTLNIESPKQWKVLPKSLARDEMESTLAAPRLRHSAART